MIQTNRSGTVKNQLSVNQILHLTSKLLTCIIALQVDLESNREGVKVYRDAFGHRLRVLLADRGMSQAELAEQAGVTQQAVSNYMTKGASPGLTTAVSIARALGVSVDDLVDKPIGELVHDR